jgi:hypothetical protein
MQEKKALDQNAIELNHQSNKLSGMKKASGNGRTAFSPSTLPLPAIMISSQPAPGVILLSPWWGTLTETGTLPVFSDYNQFILIIDSTCQPIFYTPTTDRAFDFKMQPNGTLSYFDEYLSSNIVLNLNFQIVDSYTCGNGYQTDLHEFLLLPNGHALLLGLDPEPVDMSSVVPGGNSNATAIGFVIQELDRLKNVIFQWRSMDHFKVTDATHEDLTAVTIDYAHANALAFDADSNIIVSTRHMDEITKIDRTTGNVIWRWGKTINLHLSMTRSDFHISILLTASTTAILLSSITAISTHLHFHVQLNINSTNRQKLQLWFGNSDTLRMSMLIPWVLLNDYRTGTLLSDGEQAT